jgi:predicted RNase H-like HicB family nuclease
MKEQEYTAVIERRGAWYVGYVEELPGVNTQGRTRPEVRANLEEALRLIIQANRTLSRRRRAKGVVKERIVVRA